MTYPPNNYQYTTQPVGNITPVVSNGSNGGYPQQQPSGQQMMNRYAQYLLQQNAWGQHFQMGQHIYNALFNPQNTPSVNSNPNTAPAMQTLNGPIGGGENTIDSAGSMASDSGSAMASDAGANAPVYMNSPGAGLGDAAVSGLGTFLSSRKGIIPQLAGYGLNSLSGGK